MSGALAILLWSGLGMAWLLIPTIVVMYQRIVVPRRYEEITKRFFTRPADRLTGAKKPVQPTAAALRYARLLDPDTTDAEAEKVIKDHFWYFHHKRRYRLPVFVVAILSGLMLVFSGLWLQDRLGVTSDGGWSRIPAPFVMALWGAFVWSFYELWSRWKSGDLTPVEVFDVALRFVVAIPIGYAFSLLVFDTVPSLAAFAASAFPIRDVRQLLRKQTLKKLGETPQGVATLVSKGYVGELLNGLGNDTIVRLEELSIETYLDLAYADPIRLMVKMGAPIQLVLAWIDQALLAVYAGPPLKSKFDALGMPCALDVREFYLAHCYDANAKSERKWRDDEAVKKLAEQLGVPLEILPHMLRSVSEDPHVLFLSDAWYGQP